MNTNIMRTIIILMIEIGFPCVTFSQREQYNLQQVNNAIVIGKYRRHKGLYVEQKHVLIWNEKKIPFICKAESNLSMAKLHEGSHSLLEAKESFQEDIFIDYFDENYTRNLYYSQFEQHNMEGGKSVRSPIWYSKGKSTKNIYVAYCLKGEIVVYDLKKKILLIKGYKDEHYRLPEFRHKKFAILKSAQTLSPLTQVQEKKLGLRKNGIIEIRIIQPE